MDPVHEMYEAQVREPDTGDRLWQVTLTVSADDAQMAREMVMLGLDDAGVDYDGVDATEV